MNLIRDQSFGIIPARQEGGKWQLFLILHKKGNHWAFPKGHGHVGETPLQSAMRELKEETGLDVVRLLKEEPLVEHYQFYLRENKVMKSVHYFLALVEGKIHLQGEEIRDGRWIDLNEVLKQLTFKEARSICEQVITILHAIQENS